MAKLSDLFIVRNSKSSGFESYEKGNTRFVSNGFYNNGVVGLVTPQPRDRVFSFYGICVSAFCEATVQEPPFLPRGNGGSGLVVLEPKKQMSHDELLYYAAYINRFLKWRFSFGRMVSKDRIGQLEVKEYDGSIHPSQTIEQIMPKKQSASRNAISTNFAQMKLSNIFAIVRGRGAYREDVLSGDTPLVSATSLDNGILDYVDLPPIFRAPAITVERVSGHAFVQINDFVTVPADVSVLVPKDRKMPLSCLFFLASVINLERWRYSFGRKLTAGRLKRMTILVPISQDKKIDYETTEVVSSGCYGWKEISEAFGKREKAQVATLENFL
jgi:hypothetical protein